MSIKEVSAAITQTLTQNLTNLTEHKKIQLRFYGWIIYKQKKKINKKTKENENNLYIYVKDCGKFYSL